MEAVLTLDDVFGLLNEPDEVLLGDGDEEEKDALLFENKNNRYRGVDVASQDLSTAVSINKT